MSARLVLRGDYDVWRRKELEAALGSLELTQDLTIDLRAVRIMDAGSASMLIALARRLGERTPGARVVLEGAPSIVARVLEICGAGDLFVHAPQR